MAANNEKSGKSVEERLNDLAANNKKLAEANKKLMEPKGIKSARAKPGEKLKRPDDVMKEDMENIGNKEPGELTDNERIALERYIRKYVKQGGVDRDNKKIKGGFRKGLSLEQTDKARLFLKRIGRPLGKGEIPAWDESIVVPGFGAKVR